MLTSQLDLSNNQLCGLDFLGRGTYTTEGITSIANALKVSSVTKILVCANRLGDAGAIILCKALRESKVTKVQELDLAYNQIGPEGAKAVAAMAAVVASMTRLDVSYNRFLGEEGKAVLRKAIDGHSGFKLVLGV